MSNMARSCKCFVAILLILCGLTSCDKIFESRKECPALFYADFSQLGPSIENVMIWLEDSKGNSYSEVIDKGEFGHKKEFNVAKGETRCFVWGNVKSATVCMSETKMAPRMLLVKRDNLLCDSLYFCSNNRTVLKDTAVFTPNPHKQFATIYLSVKEFERYENIVSTLNCPSRGFYYDGEIAAGASASRQEVEKGSAILRLLRQKDLDDITLDISYMLDNEGYNLDFDLGEYLRQSNYNMAEKELKDIHLSVDLINFTISITIGGWSSVFDIGVEV